MATINEVQTWQGRTVHGPDGDKIGTVEDVYLDRETGEPEWLTVKTGLFGSRVSFVPLQGAQVSGDDLRIEYDKSLVKDAPNVDADGQLSPEEERALYEHYGRGGDYREYSGDDIDAGTTGRRDVDTGTTGRTDIDERGTVGRDTSGPTTDQAMTRSEEELRVGTRSEEIGRARLRKYIVTENVQTTVPVEREEVRIEREPITDANVDNALSGPELSEEEHEVTLRAETPVVEKEVVPKERVRLDKDVTREERAVDETVRKEEIEAEGEADRIGTRDRDRDRDL
jgi:uncharacterized protein (TIGR02271 family)